MREMLHSSILAKQNDRYVVKPVAHKSTWMHNRGVEEHPTSGMEHGLCRRQTRRFTLNRLIPLGSCAMALNSANQLFFCINDRRKKSTLERPRNMPLVRDRSESCCVFLDKTTSPNGGVKCIHLERIAPIVN